MEYRLPVNGVQVPGFVQDPEEIDPTQPRTMLPRTRKKSAGGSVTNNVKPEDELGSGRGMLSRALQMVSQQPDVAALNELAQQQARQGDMSMLNALAASFAGEEFQPFQAAFLKRAMAAQEPQKVGNYGLISGGKFVADPYAARDTQANAMMDIGGELFRDEQATAREERLNRQFETRLARMGAGGGGGSASPPKFQQSDSYMLPDGRVVKGVFNPVGGQLMYQSENGLVPIPAGSRPTTAGVGSPLSQQQYINLREERRTEHGSLNVLNNYFNTVGNSSVGFRRLADQISGNAKTLFGSGLSPDELAAQVGRGQLQGLLGLFRETIVGPGVMTEYDAQRVLQALGGDFNALQNPQTVERLLRDLYERKVGRVQFIDNELSRSDPVYGETAMPFTAPQTLGGRGAGPATQGGGFGSPPPGAVRPKSGG